MALEVDEGLPFLEGVVIVSLLPLLPTLPTLPDGDGVGERGDGVPVIFVFEVYGLGACVLFGGPLKCSVTILMFRIILSFLSL